MNGEKFLTKTSFKDQIGEGEVMMSWMIVRINRSSWGVFGLFVGSVWLSLSGQSMSLEELLEVPMIEEDKAYDVLFDTASNSFIIDSELIEDLPVSTIPDLLRYAPGLHVTDASNATWGLGIRGMDSNFVGRTSFAVDEIDVYSSSVGSVDGLWSFLMEDISSVEIVYGPGGGLWRENSANGMVNVVMKTAFETEGNYGKYSLGTSQRRAEFRSGFAIGPRTSARVYGKYEDYDSRTIDSDGFVDDWTGSMFGVRVDHRPSSSDLLTGSFEYYDSELGYSKGGERFDFEGHQSTELSDGYRFLGKWSKDVGPNLQYTIKGYFSEVTYNADFEAIQLEKYGVDSNATWRISGDHSVVLGAGYEKSIYENPSREGQREGEQIEEEFRVSLRHEWDLFEDFMKLTWGGSLQDRTQSSKVAFSPTAGLSVNLSERDRLWLSWSLADKSIPNGIFATDVRDFESEQLNAWELGYKKRLGEADSFSINTFLYDYENVYGLLIESIQSGNGRPMFEVGNVASGQSFGAEISYQKELFEKLSLGINYSYIKSDFEMGDYDGSSIDDLTGFDPVYALEGSVSPHLLSLWMSYDLSNSWTATLGIRSRKWGETQWVSDSMVTQLDARVRWNPSDWLGFSVVGRNLLDDFTNEGGIRDSFNRNTEIPRTVDLEITLKF